MATERADKTPVTPEEATVLARAAGLRLAPELAAGVAQRLSAVRDAVLEARAVGVERALPFSSFAAAFAGIGARYAPRGHEDGSPHGGGEGEAGSSAALASLAEVTPRLHDLNDDLTALDLMQAARAVRSRDISPVELTQAYLERIERLDPRLRAFITVTADRALSDARRAEQEITAGNYRGVMHGIPIAHKDLLPTKGIRTTYHTDFYKEHVPDEDAPVVERLVSAGSVLLGKANTFELGAGDGEVFGLALNPWDEARQTGGSSSGSAVAVAAHLAVATTGTDAGGSIRVPAAFCAIVGLKPTAGLVAADAGSGGISVAGPMTRTVADSAAMLKAMLTPELPVGVVERYQELPERTAVGVRGLRVGVPRDWLDVHLEEGVAGALSSAWRSLEAQGAILQEVDLPHARFSETLGALLTHVECFSKYRHLLERGAKLTSFFEELLVASQLYTAADYRISKHLQSLLITETTSALEQVDVLLAPVTPYPPARLDEQTKPTGTGATPRTGMGRFTRLANLTGQPALSVPTGFTPAGVPLAVQILGRPFDEESVLRAGYVIEEANAARHARPNQD